MSRFSLGCWIESLAQDVRYALRMFRKTPVFTAVALITLTLGIGGNTAIFTLTYAMLLRSLPVQRPQELVRITFAKPDQDFGLSGPMFDEIRKRQQTCSSVFAWSDTRADITEGSEVRKMFVALASGEAFTTLGVRPALGRTLSSDDDRPGGGSNGWAAMLSYDYWVSRFGGDAGVLGRTLTVNNTPVTIIGVLPRGFNSVQVGNRTVAVLPLEFETVLHPQFAYRHYPLSMWLTVMGRLKPGATPAQAREEIRRIGPGIVHDTDPKGTLSKGFFGGSQWGAEPGATGRLYLRSTYREPLLFLQLLVGLMLLICCANVAGLMLARSSARRHEFAVRAALGASASRLVRQLCVEGGLLAIAGAVAGVELARLGSQALLNTLMGQNAVALDLAPDRGVLLFTTAIAVVATIISALPSALRATRTEPVEDLKAAHARLAGGTRAEASLVAAQIGLSVVLLVAAGLLAGSLRRLLTTDPGFSTAGQVVFPTDLSKIGNNGEGRLALYEQLLQKIAALPSVRSVSAEEIPMLSGWTSSTSLQSTLPDGSIRKLDDLYYNRIGPNYFATAGTRIITGRDVQAGDRRNAPQVCWLTRAAASYFFPNGDAVGQFLSDPAKPSDRCQIAGVVQDVKYRSLREAPRRIIYWPYMQEKDATSLRLLVHTDNIASATAEVRRVMHDLVPAAPVLEATTIREQLNESIGRERVTAMLAAFFGGLALLLAAIGVYGLLAYQVVQQTREIGVRIALGAERRDVLRLVIGRAGRLTAIGLAAGLAASFAVSRLLTGLLFEIKAYDPVSYALAAAVLLGASVIASYVPARRAASLDPMVALRYE